MKDNVRFLWLLLSFLMYMPIGLFSICQDKDNELFVDEYYKNLEQLEAQQSVVRSDDNERDKFDRPQIFISLGWNCECAYHMRQRKLSGSFYPFDWIRSEDFDEVCEVIASDCHDFLNRENLIVGERCSSKLQCVLVLDKKHKMQFLHDFPWDKKLEESYDFVKNKYTRRVERFYRALTMNKPVYFFRRKHITKAQAIKFCDLMYKKFPGLKFTLVVMHDSKELDEKWEIKNVRTFVYQSNNSANLPWYGDDEFWNRVLTTLGIRH